MVICYKSYRKLIRLLHIIHDNQLQTRGQDLNVKGKTIQFLEDMKEDLPNAGERQRFQHRKC